MYARSNRVTTTQRPEIRLVYVIIGVITFLVASYILLNLRHLITCNVSHTWRWLNKISSWLILNRVLDIITTTPWCPSSAHTPKSAVIIVTLARNEPLVANLSYLIALRHDRDSSLINNSHGRVPWPSIICIFFRQCHPLILIKGAQREIFFISWPHGFAISLKYSLLMPWW